MQNEIIYGPTLAGEEDVYLFREGTHRRIYDFLGAHPLEHEGRPGVLFALWAPGAKDVYVMGDFNCTTWSPFLQDFLQLTNYRDSRQGFGVQASWPADKWWARIPIDHAFVSKDVHVHSRVVGTPASSDHLPIIFEISAAK